MSTLFGADNDNATPWAQSGKSAVVKSERRAALGEVSNTVKARSGLNQSSAKKQNVNSNTASRQVLQSKPLQPLGNSGRKSTWATPKLPSRLATTQAAGVRIFNPAADSDGTKGKTPLGRYSKSTETELYLPKFGPEVLFQERDIAIPVPEEIREVREDSDLCLSSNKDLYTASEQLDAVDFEEYEGNYPEPELMHVVPPGVAEYEYSRPSPEYEEMIRTVRHEDIELEHPEIEPAAMDEAEEIAISYDEHEFRLETAEEGSGEQ